MVDFVIVGGGIVGLSVAKALYEKNPGVKIVVLEKESSVAKHQTGHNSGVIHSGIYYKPGSLKARLAKAGGKEMRAFCDEFGIPYDMCGKIIVATTKEELPLLDDLYERGLQNGLDVKKLCREEALEIEPHVNGKAAILVPSCGIIDYTQVCQTLKSQIEQNGGEVLLNSKVVQITEQDASVIVETNTKTIEGRYLVNCAGLHSDRIAKMTGYHVDMKIIPFRGEYFELKKERRDLVNHLIYPVPNPKFPFLGVHFTRMMNGSVEAGPNAVLGFKREGYKKTDINVKDLAEVLGYKGFWKLASKYMKEGIEEMIRSLSKQRFVKSLQQLIPEIKETDLEVAPSGVRAQALKSDGSLVDDFFIVNGKRSIHVCNAPSPAATASLQIGKAVVSRIPSEVMDQSIIFQVMEPSL